MHQDHTYRTPRQSTRFSRGAPWTRRRALKAAAATAITCALGAGIAWLGGYNFDARGPLVAIYACLVLVEAGVVVMLTCEKQTMHTLTYTTMTDGQIKSLLLARGFAIKDGCDDLTPYCYAAARAMTAQNEALQREILYARSVLGEKTIVLPPKNIRQQGKRPPRGLTAFAPVPSLRMKGSHAIPLEMHAPVAHLRRLVAHADRDACTRQLHARILFDDNAVEYCVSQDALDMLTEGALSELFQREISWQLGLKLAEMIKEEA